MKEYIITKVENKADWAKIPELDICEFFGDKAETITASAQIAYSDEALLIHLSTKEASYRKVETEILGMPCEDSCLEFFFSPINGDCRYLNIEFNANGCMFLGLGSSVDDLTRLTFVDEELFKPIIKEYADGWEIFYSIPYSFITRFFKDFKAEKGGYIMANCYKCSDKGQIQHYIAWNPIVELPRSSFHNPHCFGKMIFG